MIEVKRKANVGERIRIVEEISEEDAVGYYRTGDVMTVTSTDRWGDGQAVSVSETRWAVLHSEYVVITEEAEVIEDITVLPDESLGGVQREYNEVKRKANVGEWVKIVAATGVDEETYVNGDVLDVVDTWSNGAVDTSNLQHVFLREYVVLEPSDIVVINGERLRLVNRKAAVGERILSLVGEGKYGITKGNVYSVTRTGTNSGHEGVTVTDDNGESHGITTEFYRVLEPVSAPSPSVTQQIDGLTEAVAKLTLKNADLALQLKVAREDIVLIEEGVSADIKRLEAEVAALKRVKESARPSVSTAVTRDDIIERAKRDVAELVRTPRDINWQHPHFWPKIDGERTNWTPMQRVDFVINPRKRTVVAIIRFLPAYRNGEVFAKGIARCAPDDVFNSHIGRAIALRRALRLDVPQEYLKTPQPTEAHVGDIVTFNDHDAGKVVYRINTLNPACANCTVIHDEWFGGTDHTGGRAAGGDFSWARIIDDSREEVAA